MSRPKKYCSDVIEIPASCSDCYIEVKATAKCGKLNGHKDNHLIQETNGKEYCLIWTNE